MAKMEFEEMRKKLAIIPVAIMLVYVGGEFARNQAVGLEAGKCPISGKAANPMRMKISSKARLIITGVALGVTAQT